jgi:hypothetical protein
MEQISSLRKQKKQHLQTNKRCNSFTSNYICDGYKKSPWQQPPRARGLLGQEQPPANRILLKIRLLRNPPTIVFDEAVDLSALVIRKISELNTASSRCEAGFRSTNDLAI